MFLKMCIGRLLFDQLEINYDGMANFQERQIYLERLARGMCEKHLKTLLLVWWMKPTFFVDYVPSKINNPPESLVIKQDKDRNPKEKKKNTVCENSHPKKINF